MIDKIIRGGMAVGKAGKKAVDAYKKRRKEKGDLKKLTKEQNEAVEKLMGDASYKKQRQRDLDATVLRMFRKSKENPTGAKNLEEAKRMAKETDDFIADTLKRKSDLRYKKGGKVKTKTKPKTTKKFRGDGIARKGKTKGRFV